MNAEDRASNPAGATRWLTILPVAIFAALGTVFAFQLFTGEPGKLPSALILKPVPKFTLPQIDNLAAGGKPVPGFSDADLKAGKVTVVNFFASWCPPCREEHPQLLDLAKDERIRLYGVNYKDEPDNARRFLAGFGNPFAAIGADRSGTVAIDWGFYGAPETFIVKGDGTIVYKQIGAITPQILDKIIRPKIEAALKAD
ncbi:MAG: DsbE family thiol:disulfide interchange protein [Beijerinckiaceae bacterium]|nr:DsbE family thiol:disulfide interchange protein [Beijerinckiaceae bacterium]